MSDSQLLSAQQMARHLSRVMTLSQRPGAARPQLGALLDSPLQEGSTPLPSPSPAAAGAAASGGEGGRSSSSGGGGPSSQPSPSKTDGVLGSVGSAEEAAGEAERRDWLQAKLLALVDSIKQLELDAYQERLKDPNAGGAPACWGSLGHAGCSLQHAGCVLPAPRGEAPGRHACGCCLRSGMAGDDPTVPTSLVTAPVHCSRPAHLHAGGARAHQHHAAVRRLPNGARR